MKTTKDMLLEDILVKSRDEAGRLSREFARAASEEREAILAQLELEQWMAETCEICIDPSPNQPL